MTTALVVGCDDYPGASSAANSGSAVSDAVAVRDWLLNGGGVGASDLRMLLSPAAGSILPQGVHADGPADLSRLALELDTLVGRRSGDRLYVYIAAHGCPSSSAAPYLSQPLILLPDMAAPVRSGTAVDGIAVEELVGLLGQADFDEVVSIIDCDRGPPHPSDHTLSARPFGAATRSRRRSGTAQQFRLEAPGPGAEAPARDGSAGRLTSALLAALNGVTAVDAAAVDAAAVDATAIDATENADSDTDVRGLRWSSLQRRLASVLTRPPFVAGPNPALVLTGVTADTRPGSSVPATGMSAGSEPAGQGDVLVRSTDPNAMLIIEDRSGVTCAVGVGSIAGRLPAGSYTAVLADPSGHDPWAALTVRQETPADAVLTPRLRADGFRATDHSGLTFSSPAAQLALATSALWSFGHQSFLLVGGAPTVPPAEQLLEGYPERFASHGVFGTGVVGSGGLGWWMAVPVHGLWHTIRLGKHRITVPAAPDSVSALAITAAGTTVALFDTTHPAPDEIAAQDRVQEYLAIGRLGAADLTSRSSVRTGQRWPWGASAAVRRLIDRTRSSRLPDDSGNDQDIGRTVPASPADPAVTGTTEDHSPPFEFRADVPPHLRRLLVGRGPWAVWLDWPPSAPVPASREAQSELGAG